MLLFPLGVFLEKTMGDRVMLDLHRSSDKVKIFVFLARKHAVIQRVLHATLPALFNFSLPRWVNEHFGEVPAGRV